MLSAATRIECTDGLLVTAPSNLSVDLRGQVAKRFDRSITAGVKNPVRATQFVSVELYWHLSLGCCNRLHIWLIFANVRHAHVDPLPWLGSRLLGGGKWCAPRGVTAAHDHNDNMKWCASWGALQRIVYDNKHKERVGKCVATTIALPVYS